MIKEEIFSNFNQTLNSGLGEPFPPLLLFGEAVFRG